VLHFAALCSKMQVRQVTKNRAAKVQLNIFQTLLDAKPMVRIAEVQLCEYLYM
jgi:hypothetical protein